MVGPVKVEVTGGVCNSSRKSSHPESSGGGLTFHRHVNPDISIHSLVIFSVTIRGKGGSGALGRRVRGGISLGDESKER